MATTDTSDYQWVSPASKAFQVKMIKLFQEVNVNGVSIIQADCPIDGFENNRHQAISNHNLNLQAYQQRCREKNLKINHKWKFFYRESFPHGSYMKPDEKKVHSIM